MRLTVGPLPSVVYWRRRAVVAGILLVLIAFVIVRCGVSGHRTSAHPGHSRAPSASPLSHPPSLPPSPLPTIGGTVLLPSATAPDSGDQQSPQAEPTIDIPRSPAPQCSDSDIAVTAEASPAPGRYGGTMFLSVKVVNISGHDCSRDIGSDAQELRVQQGATLIWTSDECVGAQTSDVRLFHAGVGVRFTKQWYTRRVAPNMCVDSSPAPPGAYQVVARLGSRLSEPVSFEIKK